MKAIIFDFDGVIHDTFSLAFEINRQITPEISEEEYKTYFDVNLFKSLENKPKDHSNKFRELEFEAFKKLILEKEIKEELQLLNEHYDLYIISSNTLKNLNMYFENNNFTNIFKEILAAEAHKSKIEKFKMLFKKYNLDSNSCIFITDTLGDILEANKVGVKSIACTFGFHEEDRLKKGDPFKIVSNFKEIRDIIENL